MWKENIGDENAIVGFTLINDTHIQLKIINAYAYSLLSKTFCCPFAITNTLMRIRPLNRFKVPTCNTRYSGPALKYFPA